jgi:hypothetical protein
MNRSELPIVSPCGADWQGMTPRDVASRFCDACSKHVHDLSRMTQAEARRLLAAPATEGLCVRYLHDERGNVLFAQAPLVPSSRLASAKRLAAATLATASLSLSACMGEPVPPVPPPTPMMGAVACPMPPPPAPTASASSAPSAVPAAPVAAPR